MKFEKSDRGFGTVTHEGYPSNKGELRLVQQSSAIGPYDDSFDKPGSSYLWIGERHHLNRADVYELVEYLQRWLRTGSLEVKAD